MPIGPFVFRRLAVDELDAGYAVLMEVWAWLESRQIRQWVQPLPREVFTKRHGRGENFGLFVDDRLSAIVSLIRGIPKYWHDEVEAGDRETIWMTTLACR